MGKLNHVLGEENAPTVERETLKDVLMKFSNADTATLLDEETPLVENMHKRKRRQTDNNTTATQAPNSSEATTSKDANTSSDTSSAEGLASSIAMSLLMSYILRKLLS